MSACEWKQEKKKGMELTPRPLLPLLLLLPTYALLLLLLMSWWWVFEE